MQYHMCHVLLWHALLLLQSFFDFLFHWYICHFQSSLWLWMYNLMAHEKLTVVQPHSKLLYLFFSNSFSINDRFKSKIFGSLDECIPTILALLSMFFCYFFFRCQAEAWLELNQSNKVSNALLPLHSFFNFLFQWYNSHFQISLWLWMYNLMAHEKLTVLQPRSKLLYLFFSINDRFKSEIFGSLDECCTLPSMFILLIFLPLPSSNWTWTLAVKHSIKCATAASKFL
jgi:hypothetical protein